MVHISVVFPVFIDIFLSEQTYQLSIKQSVSQYVKYEPPPLAPLVCHMYGSMVKQLQQREDAKI